MDFFLRQLRFSLNWIFVIHVLLGIMLATIPGVARIWQIAVLIIGCFDVYQHRNRSNRAGIYAAYFAGMEVMVRMTGQSVFWEFGKYGVVLLLVLGIWVSKRKFIGTYLIYFLLFIPSILIAGYVDWAQARDMISFNLSGPLCLAVSALYFHKQHVTGKELVAIVRSIVFPVLVMLVYLFVRTPEFTEIEFNTQSNVLASGGYGPNQVSLILGMAIFFIAAFQIFGVNLTGYRWLDYLIMLLLAFRALITFSRGGVAGAALALAVLIIITIFSTRSQKRIVSIAGSVFLVAIGSWLVWDYTNSLTNDTLAYRYVGINPRTGNTEEYTTGRLFIIQRDLRLFLSNPLLGVGPGKSTLETSLLDGRRIASHTEWTRMLAEHGIFGLIALGILFIGPIGHAFKQFPTSRGLLLAIYVLAMFSMFHAAMRLSIISFLYALALIIPTGEKNSIRRK